MGYLDSNVCDCGMWCNSWFEGDEPIQLTTDDFRAALNYANPELPKLIEQVFGKLAMESAADVSNCARSFFQKIEWTVSYNGFVTALKFVAVDEFGVDLTDFVAAIEDGRIDISSWDENKFVTFPELFSIAGQVVSTAFDMYANMPRNVGMYIDEMNEFIRIEHS